MAFPHCSKQNTRMYVQELYGIMNIYLTVLYTEIGVVSPPFLEL